MTPQQRKTVLWWGALAVGVGLFALALYLTDFSFIRTAGRSALIATVLAIAASGAWHLARTWAWSRSFTQAGRVPFSRLARVRIAAEAFSYLTIRGLAGEPLKVMLLRGDVDSREATAAVALERIAFMLGTVIIVGVGSAGALLTQQLTPLWFRVFAAFVAATVVIILFIALVLMGEGTYFGRVLGSGRIGRFAADVETQLLQLVRHEPARLVKLMGATTAAYLFMCAEVWLVAWAIGIEMSFSGAMAIETFSRVVSFATIFIPANLGGLEVSSIAASAAIGASGVGAPLAFARRMRGLFWAGFGLAAYPRPRAAVARSGATLLYVPTDPAVTISPFDRLAGLSIAERAMRSAFRAGYARVIVLADDTTVMALRQTAARVGGEIRVVRSPEWSAAVQSLPPDSQILALGAGTVVSHTLLEDAARGMSTSAIADVPAGPEWPISGLVRASREDAADAALLSQALHARLIAPVLLPSGKDVSWGRAKLALRARHAVELEDAESTIRASVIKPTDNKVARWNRGMSLPISIALIRTPLTANQLSIALVVVGFYSGWLYSLGTYFSMVLASVLGLIASILDGCDGEIARLKYQESALGAWIETVGDYSYYVAIFIGMTVGVAKWTGMPVFFWFGVVTLAGTFITFALLIYLRSVITAGRPSELHAVGKSRFNAEPSFWTRMVWKVSMVATRSFMPYMILGLAILGLMPIVLFLAAVGANVYWVSLALKWRALVGAAEADTAAA